MAIKLRAIFSLITWFPLQYLLKWTSVLKFLLCSLGQVGTSADSVGRAIPWLTGKQIPGTAVRTLAVVWELQAADSGLHSSSSGRRLSPSLLGLGFSSELGTAGYVPVAPVLFIGLLSAGYKIRWLLLVQGLLGWSFVSDALWCRDAVQGGLGCSLRADTPVCKGLLVANMDAASSGLSA